MNAAQRRDAILTCLRGAQAPLSATALAGRFSVSRQIIVGDVALLRAAGEKIYATPRGYVLDRGSLGVEHTVVCSHTSQDMGRELYLMVDNGCTVENVVVEHPVYGQLTGQLRLASRYDVDQFIRRVNDQEAKPLSLLTNGIHLHTLRCPDEAACRRTLEALRAAGFLLEESPLDLGNENS